VRWSTQGESDHGEVTGFRYRESQGKHWYSPGRSLAGGGRLLPLPEDEGRKRHNEAEYPVDVNRDWNVDREFPILGRRSYRVELNRYGIDPRSQAPNPQPLQECEEEALYAEMKMPQAAW